MADGFTPYYNLIKPEIGGSPDTWGQKLNSNSDIIDSVLNQKVHVDGTIDITGFQKFAEAGLAIGQFVLKVIAGDLMFLYEADPSGSPGVYTTIGKLQPDGTLTFKEVIADPGLV